MKKYFYSDGIEKFGPFSLEELKKQKLTRETKIWYYGLQNWTALSEIEELKMLVNSIPPKLPQSGSISNHAINTTKNSPPPRAKSSRKRRKWIILSAITLPCFFIGIWIVINVIQQKWLYNEVLANTYDMDVDFDIYVNKFYRDIENYGIFPQRPKVQTIKFADLSKIKGLTDIHGIAFGMNDDEKIEIYINYESWEKFNKPKRYFLMYHELAHDVLNLEHVAAIEANERKLMYPAIGTYDWVTMDDFIESSHAAFEEITGN